MQRIYRLYLKTPTEIGQVWTNLIRNAMYAMDNGGTLTIKIKVTDNDFITVSINDTSTGTDPENLSRISDPFYTTKPSGEGSDLGLDISKKIITKHYGTISIESTQGVGTKFIVSLLIQQPFDAFVRVT